VINVDGPPEDWAGQVAALMVDRGRQPAQLLTFFRVVFHRRRRN
jgi:hypothetical protein